MHTNLQLKGVFKLLGLQYKILYRKRVDNKVVDALSQRPISEDVLLSTDNSIQCTWMQHIIKSYEGDAQVLNLITHLSIDAKAHQGYSYRDGLLFFKDKIVVGSYGSLRKQLLELYHNSQLGGHSGINATYVGLKRLFFGKKCCTMLWNG